MISEKKILFISHESDINGASRSLLEIIKKLEYTYCIYVLVYTTKGRFYNELKKRNVKVICEPYYRWCISRGTALGWMRKKLLWELYWSRKTDKVARKIAAYCNQEHIDLIHSNSSVINIGGLISKYSGIKHIWHIREFGDLDFNMYPLVNRHTYRTFINRFSDRVIFNSNAVAEHFDFINTDKKIVVYNGVSLDNVIENKDKISHSGINLLISGRISAAKGQDQAIRACINLYSKGYDNIRLFIAGRGDIKTVFKDKLPSFVICTGNLSDLRDLRKKVDIELVCSKAEAFGRVTIEAMMGGIPVVGSNTGGTKELIEDNFNGLLYSYGDSEDLSNQIQKIIDDKEMRIRMGNNARSYAINNFSIDRCVKKIESVYNEVI